MGSDLDEDMNDIKHNNEETDNKIKDSEEEMTTIDMKNKFSVLLEQMLRFLLNK